MTREYKYDVAVSLCKQDVDFARRLVNNIAPSLKVFFYENNQEALISKCGPEVFGRIFKQDSRVVVILSREEWSESFYTEIERNAIIDRTSVKNEGYQFLMVIPMEPNQIPSWYPSTRLYADPRRFTVEQLASFIEFKVTESGGIVRPTTLEDLYTQFERKYEEKRHIVFLQETEEAIKCAKEEIRVIKQLFNGKVNTLRMPLLGPTSHFLFSEHVWHAQIEIEKFALRCTITSPENDGLRVVTTQDFSVNFKLSQAGPQEQLLIDNTLLFVYTQTIKGWATPITREHLSARELDILFRDRRNRVRYELKDPIASEQVVDSHFKILFNYAAAGISRYI